MPLSKRTKTRTANDESTASSEPDHSDAGKDISQMDSLQEAQLEIERQGGTFDAQGQLQKRVERPFFAKARFVLPFGIILGLLLGCLLNNMQEMHAHLGLLMEERDISLRIPEIDFSRVEVEWGRLRSNIPPVWKLNNDGREFQAGEAMKRRGLTAQHPVVLVPGIVSTGLESWSTSPEYRAFFREKLWGGFNMLSQVTFNRDKWIAAMMLDPNTGLDPPGVKIRAAEGVDAASSFMKGYWLWAKIIENLAVVGYDTNNLHLASYDWRLSMWNLEERDGYFSRLKATIEGFKKRQGKRVVLAAHSMGSTVRVEFLHFKWVESSQHGGGGPDWVENHIETFVSIAGTHLAKAMAAFLSGEMKDTVQMNPAGAYVLERFFSRKERQKLFRSWAGSASMWVKGGNAVWGDETWAPDDEYGALHTHGELISFRHEMLVAQGAIAAEQLSNMTAETAGTWILERTPTSFQKMIWTNYSFGIERDVEVLKRNDLDHRKWTNPLEMRYAHGPHESEEPLVDAETAMCTGLDTNTCNRPRAPLDYLAQSHSSWIDADYSDENVTPKVRNGVKMGEGDGTVSLLSLGAMCVEGWKRPRWNPGRINVTTVELPHRPVPRMPRGGANTSDHVDILGSTGLNELLLKVATGVGHEIEDSFVSHIREYARRVRWD
ncbi:hypothetical protein PAXRUDRAFT_834720 [Paxillus rubicundulus Ve08.2h10]|uniref:Phospholipid:diacylglycerol acyltransferase n=1 Tax=Paxillus rubicundulus Ve08.2h10 TaxID=930991 RepID=A0A0D0DBW7_9AGAM|nr:hypothetical protein PAXRUDRAFT_834720 [Paxillus rubicundulus Ve08.2h10]